MAREVVFVDWCDYCTREDQKQRATETLVVTIGRAKPRVLMACTEHADHLAILQAVYAVAAPAEEAQVARGSRRPEKATQPVLEAPDVPQPTDGVTPTRVCVICGMDYTTKSAAALTMHTAKAHGVTPSSFDSTCPLCGTTTDGAQGLGTHISNTHGKLRSTLEAAYVAQQEGDPHGVVARVLQQARQPV